MQYIFFATILLFSCNEHIDKATWTQASETTFHKSLINKEGQHIQTRFPAPEGFKRNKKSEPSFGYYLRNLPLHPNGHKVHLYDGSLKYNQTAQAAVIKMDVGSKDLQQCADAVMRLRAEHLYAQKEYQKIHFNFTNGFKASFDQWRKGKGIRISGNKVSWVANSKNDSSYESFRRYLTIVFSYAGTASLSKELRSKSVSELDIGDIFIRGGHPGHTVIVVDKAMNPAGKTVFLLAQSYMPAQEIHVLKNPMNVELSPWYALDQIQDGLRTPEYDFTVNQLKTFE